MRFRNCGIPMEEMLAVSSTAGCALAPVFLAVALACIGVSAAIVMEAGATSDIQRMYAPKAPLTNTDGKFLPNRYLQFMSVHFRPANNPARQAWTRGC